MKIINVVKFEIPEGKGIIEIETFEEFIQAVEIMEKISENEHLIVFKRDQCCYLAFEDYLLSVSCSNLNRNEGGAK